MEIEIPPFIQNSDPKARTAIDTKVIKWEDVLTKKESDMLKPRVQEALKVAFTYMDKGIGVITKEPTARQVYIWSSITKEEIEVIATSLVETGQRSRIVATLTRKVARDYMKLQLGIILIPRFVMSVQHLMTHGIRNPFNSND